MNTEYKVVEAGHVLEEMQQLKADGYHLIQQCATRIDHGYELIYSFGRELEVQNLKITLDEDSSISSITSIFPCAFVYENEMHDLFGVDIKMINLDYHGNLYRTAVETPFK